MKCPSWPCSVDSDLFLGIHLTILIIEGSGCSILCPTFLNFNTDNLCIKPTVSDNAGRLV